jgi:hypothetical protein
MSMTYTYQCGVGDKSRRTVDMAVIPEPTKECGRTEKLTGFVCTLPAIVQYPGKMNPPKFG